MCVPSKQKSEGKQKWEIVEWTSLHLTVRKLFDFLSFSLIRDDIIYLHYQQITYVSIAIVS